MTVRLPPPLDRLIASINGGDTEAFLALFPADGVVDDWGRRFKGHAAIRRWSDKELIGAKGVMTVESVTAKGGEIAIEADWKSNYYSGASRIVFTVADGLVHEMRIVAG